jgi:hypothetical protein
MMCDACRYYFIIFFCSHRRPFEMGKSRHKRLTAASWRISSAPTSGDGEPSLSPADESSDHGQSGGLPRSDYSPGYK